MDVDKYYQAVMIKMGKAEMGGIVGGFFAMGGGYNSASTQCVSHVFPPAIQRHVVKLTGVWVKLPMMYALQWHPAQGVP